MINPDELRRGNLLSWNPKLIYSSTTLAPTFIEVVEILGDEIGYLEPQMDHRSEPFEDDVLALKPKHVPLDQLEGIMLTPDVLEGCCTIDGKPVAFDDQNKTLGFINEGRHYPLPRYLHQLQNLYFTLTGKEMQVTLPQG